MESVRAKKHLGQHFLTDKQIALRIVQGLKLEPEVKSVVEVGPGMGVLSDWLLQEKAFKTYLLDIDEESINYLHQKYPQHKEQIRFQDFLALNFESIDTAAVAVIGNFPYNISSQILFKVLDNRNIVPVMVGMFQKEVAERVVSKHGNKVYGILSVLIQAFYDTEYLFTVKPGSFNPAPKVNSAVIRLKRKAHAALPCDEVLFFRVVKTAFNQRRKTLRNALSSLLPKEFSSEFLQSRAEQLSVDEFIALTLQLQKAKE